MSGIMQKAAIFVVILVALSPSQVQAQVLYGCTFPNRQLITINTATGAGTVIGTMPSGFGAPVGIAFRGPTLYAAMSSGNLMEIDPVTAGMISTINLGVPAGQEGAVAFRADGIGFLDLNGQYRFDISGPPAVTPLPGPFVTNDGLAFDAAGTLFGLNQGGDQLLTINQATGARTLVGNTGISGKDLGGLAFDATGKLFAVLGPNGGPSDFFQIDPATGVGTLIGPVGVNVLSGLAFGTPGPPPPPPPPPSPPPTPSGGINEGDYPGSKGLANGTGGEGTFGFGRQLRTLQPFLKGPHRDANGVHRVFNVQHQQPQPIAETDSGLGVLGWGLLGLAILAPAALVFARRRAA